MITYKFKPEDVRENIALILREPSELTEEKKNELFKKEWDYDYIEMVCNDALTMLIGVYGVKYGSIYDIASEINVKPKYIKDIAKLAIETNINEG